MTFPRNLKLASFLVLTALIGALSSFLYIGAGKVAAESAEKPGPQPPTRGKVELKPEAITRSEIASEAAEARTIQVRVNAYGTLGMNDEKIAHVVSQIGGIARVVSRKVGDRVQKGDVLCVIESREVADAKIAYLTASKQLELAQDTFTRESSILENSQKLVELLSKGTELERVEADLKHLTIGESRAQLIPAYTKLKLATQIYEREKLLVEKKISAQYELAAAAEEMKSSDARFKALLEQTKLDVERNLREKKRAVELSNLDVTVARQKLLAVGMSSEEISGIQQAKDWIFTNHEIKAPISGTILERKVSQGEWLAAQEDLFFIADLSTVWANIGLQSDRLKRVKLGQRVFITSDAVEGETVGELVYLGNTVDEKSASVTGRINISNESGAWRPGLYVTGAVVLEEKQAAQAVSVDAIQIIDNNPVVFVQEGNSFSMRNVKLGLSDGKFTEILDGVRAGEMYVVRNSFVLKAHVLSEGGK